MQDAYRLTTFDNPFDPFEQFTSWFLYDEEQGYHTCAYLGRIAIDEIIKYDFRNVYKKVARKAV